MENYISNLQIEQQINRKLIANTQLEILKIYKYSILNVKIYITPIKKNKNNRELQINIIKLILFTIFDKVKFKYLLLGQGIASCAFVWLRTKEGEMVHTLFFHNILTLY